jgi:glyoxylase-like metal-dependent hydrolase (beta-lactamase superfamily II)
MNRLEGQVYATETYEKEWKEDLGMETVRLHDWGPAHTSGDSVIHFQKADVVHTGDLVFNRVAPVIDTQGGSSVENWIVLLERMHKEFSHETIFVFGHGSETHGVTGSRADVLAMRDYLTALLSFVRAGVKSGLTADALAASTGLPGFEPYAAGNLLDRFRGGIRQTYQQLVPPAR